MTVYDLRLEPRKFIPKEMMVEIIEEAFKPYGGLFDVHDPPVKVEILNID